MKLKFLKIKKENIFCEDFNNMVDNNVINFDNTNINILYAPNGVGKSSFCKVLDDKGEFILNYGDKEYSSNNCNLFHVINDQNSRNIIKGKTKDFLLGDNIAKEYELKEWIDDKFDDVYKDIRLLYKNELNLSKVNDNKLSCINAGLTNILKKNINIRTKSVDVDIDEFYNLIQNIKYINIEEYDKRKFKYIITDNNYDIIMQVKKISDIKMIKDFFKIEQYDDAINILNKYKSLNNCIVCETEINANQLLIDKKNSKDNIVSSLDEDAQKILNNIIEKIGEDDPFNIKYTLKNAISTGNVEGVVNLIKEIDDYILLYKNILTNTLVTSLNDEFIKKYLEYKEMLSRDLNITDEDLMFIEEFIEKNINKTIKLQRANNKIVITLDSEDIIGVERENLKLSSGEQNFISLTFELLKAKNVNNEIIVIDDPISSFDSIFKNKLVYAIIKFLDNKKVLLLTHNMDLIKLVEFQTNREFNIYLFNNFEGQKNGFILINENEKKILISITDLLEFIRSNTILSFIKNEKLYIYSLIPFMRGYVKYIGENEGKDKLTKLMHGYENIQIDLGKIYNDLFKNRLSNSYIVIVNDILSIDINNLDEIIDKNSYPLLNKVLCNNLVYLYLRLITEKVLVNKYNINTAKYDQLSSIIYQAFKENTIENNKNKIFFFSKKTLLNEFNHFEGNMNIFQPAIDISEVILKREKEDIINRLNKL